MNTCIRNAHIVSICFAVFFLLVGCGGGSSTATQAAPNESSQPATTSPSLKSVPESFIVEDDNGQKQLNVLYVVGQNSQAIDTIALTDVATGWQFITASRQSASAVGDSLTESESNTYILEADSVELSYMVSVLIISEDGRVIFEINGTRTDLLDEGDTYILPDGARLEVQKVLINLSGELGAKDVVEFALCADETAEVAPVSIIGHAIFDTELASRMKGPINLVSIGCNNEVTLHYLGLNSVEECYTSLPEDQAVIKLVDGSWNDQNISAILLYGGTDEMTRLGARVLRNISQYACPGETERIISRDDFDADGNYNLPSCPNN